MALCRGWNLCSSNGAPSCTYITRVAHAERGAGGGAVTTVKKKRVQSHRPEGRRIAARLGGWWRLGLNWRRVVAVCLRAG